MPYLFTVLFVGLIVPGVPAFLATPIVHASDSCDVQARTMEEIDRLLAQATPGSEDDVAADTTLEEDLKGEAGCPIGDRRDY